MQPKYKFTYARLKIALIIAISFFSFFAKTQETDSVRIAINIILAPLNKTLIPTGILATNAYSQDSIKATSVARQKYLKKSNSQ